MAEFNRCHKLQGLDTGATPRWQMVPVGGYRWVALKDGAGLTVTSSNPAVVTVTEIRRADMPSVEAVTLDPTDRIFRLHGASKGNAHIFARRGTTTVTELEVDTKNKLTKRVSFHFVRDEAGHATNRSDAAATEWANGMNYIYKFQANIEVLRRLVRWVTVPGDLGTSVDTTSYSTTSAADEWNRVVAMTDPGADFNIFLVRRFELTDTAAEEDAAQEGANCIFEDDAGWQIAETMAHELGHRLGLPDQYDNARKRELMYGYTDTRGIHLPKADVNRINP